jgi:hypothetical protein
LALFLFLEFTFISGSLDDNKSMENKTPWYSTLSESNRESLFSVMRKLNEEQYRYEVKSRGPYGMIPVGSAHFDELLKSVVIAEFLRCLNRGMELAECLPEVYKTSRECIEKHNSKSRDINWERHETAGDSFADLIHTRIKVSQG